MLEAQFNARDQLDFSRTGSFTAIRFISQTVPFLNARLQGLDKLGRAGMTKGQLAQFYSVVGLYSIASTALYLAMADDDDYKDAEDWEKRTYHLFKLPGSDKMYRIPRPFEVGAIAFLAEKMTEQVVDQNAQSKELKMALWHTFNDTFSMNPIPQAFKPLIEIFGNKSMFTGRNIESMAMQRSMSKTERYQPWTSEIAKGASKAMATVTPEALTLSPVQIQHLVRSYTGWLGATILAGADGVVRMATHKTMPKKKWYENSINPVQSFMRDTEGKSTKWMTRFYDNLDTLGKLWGDVKNDRKERLTGKEQAQLDYKKEYGQVQRKLSKLRREQKAVYKNKSMSAERKRKVLDMYRKEMNKLVKELVEPTDKFF